MGWERFMQLHLREASASDVRTYLSVRPPVDFDFHFGRPGEP
jgi:hypothetical protein